LIAIRIIPKGKAQDARMSGWDGQEDSLIAREEYHISIKLPAEGPK